MGPDRRDPPAAGGSGEQVDPDVDRPVARPREPAQRQWDVLIAVAAGGVLGAEARYALGVALPHTPAEWPWSTLLVNISGCLLIGVLMVSITELASPQRLVRPFLGVGVLGGYTTFSTYSVELVQLLTTGRPGAALGYLTATPIAALAGAWAGVTLTRALGRIHLRPRRGHHR